MLHELFKWAADLQETCYVIRPIPYHSMTVDPQDEDLRPLGDVMKAQWWRARIVCDAAKPWVSRCAGSVSVTVTPPVHPRS